MTKDAGGDAGHLPPLKSEQKDWSPGATLEFADFVGPKGSDGKRVCIDRFVVRVTGVITVAGAAFDGRDVCRLLQNIVVEQRDGRHRWNLTGFKSRIASIKYNGIDRHDEHADIAIAAGATVDFRIVIPMAKRFTRRPKDYSLPADLFRKITINCASLAGAATGATVLSANDLDVYVLAEFHEEDADEAIEAKSEDTVKAIDFTSNTQVRATLSGAVHDMDIVRETTTAGGGLITGITDARVDDLGIPQLTRSDLKHSYTERRGIAPSALTTGAERFNDPWRGGTALAIITATPETSVWDGKVVESAKVDVGTGAAGLALITREILDKSQSNFNTAAATWNAQASTARAKTASKSKRELSNWTKNPRALRVMPLSVLRRAG
jgi:hypothetical protein